MYGARVGVEREGRGEGSLTPITLYGVQSPNVLKVAILLEELSVPYDLRHVAVFRGAQFEPEFLRLNPLAKVPVIEDPELEAPLTESGAILFYLAERFGAFLPDTGFARYEVMQWLMVQMSSIGPMLGQFTHFSLLPPDSEPYGRGRYGSIARRLYRLVDERLANREWIAGGTYSIADIATAPWAEYLERHGLAGSEYPAMLRWRQAIAGRPAVIRAKARIESAFGEPTRIAIAGATAADLDRFFGRTDDMPEQDFSSVKRMR